MTYKVGYVIGSLREDSINRQYADALVSLAPEGLEFEELEIKDIPLFNQDDEADFPQKVQEFKKKVEGVDAIVFFTPEYNRQYPGVLKNALDYGSRPWGDNSWDSKPAAVISVAGSNFGGSMANNAFRTAIQYHNMPVMSQPEMYISFTDDLVSNGKFVKPEAKAYAQTWMDKFEKFVEKQAK